MRDAGFERVAYRNLTAGIVALHRGFVPSSAGSAGAVPSALSPEAVPTEGE
jgi:demethylmenaquinone methyltransferase/2-methoxy-6-polyprenyl-1,4-benzoquinol methylase